MFKTRCSKCTKKVDKSFDFCPYCGVPMKSKEEYGLLGKSDDINELHSMFSQNLPGGVSNSIFEKMIGSAMKLIEKEMQKASLDSMRATREMQKLPQHMPANNSNFELFVNGKRVNIPGNIAGLSIEEMPSPEAPKQNKQTKIPKVSDELIKNSAKLPRKEAKTKLIRTADKVTYELDTPGLTTLNNVLINKLEDSLEVKAYTERAVFFKTLKVKLSLARYSLREDKLVLEFNTQ